MSAATNYFETMCLNPLRGVPATAPAQVYVSLFLTVPTEEGAGTEVSGGGYARQPVTFSEPAADGNGKSGISNLAAITFPTAVSGWGTVQAVAIHDSASAGNMLQYVALSSPKEIVAGTTLSFVAGELTITADGMATNYYKAACLNLLRGVSIAAITAPSLALFLSDPGHAGSGTEVTATGYARQALAFNAPAEQSGGNMMIDNSALIAFARATVVWGAVPWIGVMSAATGGSTLFRAAANPAVTIGIADRFTIEAGGLRLLAN